MQPERISPFRAGFRGGTRTLARCAFPTMEGSPHHRVAAHRVPAGITLAVVYALAMRRGHVICSSPFWNPQQQCASCSCARLRAQSMACTPILVAS